MDNLTHSLFGLALAQSGLRRASRFGTATLLVGANLPDVDAFAYLVGTNSEALAFRRGWTHGILAMVVLPVLLALAGWGIGKLLRPHPVKGTASWRGLLLLAAIGVWSHPLLDLLNVYGIRLLMPFSGHWFKADALFIIDPWMWLVLLGGLVLGRVRASPRPSRGALGVFAGYALVMAVLGRIGPGIVAGQTGVEARTMAAPGPLNPLRRQVLRDLGPEYESGELRFGFPPAYRSGNRIPAGRNDPGAREAAASPDGRWFLRWARFPVFVSEPVHGGLRVTIQDLRFGRSIRNGSWASISVLVPRPGSGAPAP